MLTMKQARAQIEEFEYDGEVYVERPDLDLLYARRERRNRLARERRALKHAKIVFVNRQRITIVSGLFVRTYYAAG